MPTRHPPEFRQLAVELAQLMGKPIAEGFGTSKSCLGHWLAQGDMNAGHRQVLASTGPYVPLAG